MLIHNIFPILGNILTQNLNFMKFLYAFTAFLLLSVSTAFAQTSVTGTVNDDAGLPLAGVNIVEKGTSNGTSTNFDGNYEITVANNATLVFSYVGFATTENEGKRSIYN